MTTGRDLEAVVLGEGGEVEIAAGKLERLGELLVVDVGDPLEEEQREDVALEVGLIDRAAQDVRRTPKMLLELGERELGVWRDAQALLQSAHLQAFQRVPQAAWTSPE